MGIDAHALNFLTLARTKQAFGRVATIGRQGLYLSSYKLMELLRLEREPAYGPFCENLLISHFGASAVESFDNSNFEGATHTVDMNKPLVQVGQYDTVLDGGCTEHIYNAPQALHNISKMCADRGQILHILPANNFCGHGFWQFSPELFFSLYSTRNGYSETEVYLADLANEDVWYQVKQPKDGRRAIATSSTPVYALVRTKRSGPFSHENIQQSDYVYGWSHTHPEQGLSDKPPAANLDKIKTAIEHSPFVPNFVTRGARAAHKLSYRATNKLVSTFLSSERLCARNPHLVRITVSSLINGSV
jgi:hypothetical protein